MTSQSEQLEWEVEATRRDLSRSLQELRSRVTLQQAIDRAINFAHSRSIAEFLRNLGRDVRENSLPLLLIGAGVRPRMGSPLRAI